MNVDTQRKDCVSVLPKRYNFRHVQFWTHIKTVREKKNLTPHLVAMANNGTPFNVLDSSWAISGDVVAATGSKCAGDNAETPEVKSILRNMNAAYDQRMWSKALQDETCTSSVPRSELPKWPPEELIRAETSRIGTEEADKQRQQKLESAELSAGSAGGKSSKRVSFQLDEPPSSGNKENALPLHDKPSKKAHKSSARHAKDYENDVKEKVSRKKSKKSKQSHKRLSDHHNAVAAGVSKYVNNQSESGPLLTDENRTYVYIALASVLLVIALLITLTVVLSQKARNKTAVTSSKFPTFQPLGSTGIQFANPSAVNPFYAGFANNAVSRPPAPQAMPSESASTITALMNQISAQQGQINALIARQGTNGH